MDDGSYLDDGQGESQEAEMARCLRVLAYVFFLALGLPQFPMP